jgi:dTDP-glucose pyrophosphorylase
MDGWEKSTLYLTDTMEIAVKVLEENRVLGIGLVVDQNQKLLGTVTDGDIRRAIIRHCSMDTPVSELMNHEPAIATTRDSQEKIRQVIAQRFVARVPVINDDGVVVGLLGQDSVHTTTNYNNSILLMAGGYGRRLYPLTQSTPKPLLKVAEKPILEAIVEQLSQQGFENLFISLHYRSQMIKDYFGDGSKWNVAIQYLEENQPLGTAGALGLIHSASADYPIMVINGDLMTRMNYGRLIAFHKEQGGVATVCVREYEHQIPYGVVGLERGTVSRIDEKPSHKCFINAGIYVLDEAVVRTVDEDSPLDMTDLLSSLVAKGERVNAYPIHEYWIDIGRVSEYKRANQDVGYSLDNS